MAYRDPEVRRARDRERFQRRTAKRIARGLCPRCGQLPPELERSLCAPCGEKRNKASRARDAKFRIAGKPRRDPAKARACERERRRRQTAERIAHGLCPKCGRHPPEPGGSLCEPCGEKRRAADCNRYAEGKAAAKLYGGRDPEYRRRLAREKAASASAPVARSASAPAADRIRPSKAERSASHAATRGARPNANSMPRGGQPVSASSAERRPSTAARAATHAPCARAGAIRRRRTQPPDGSTPGGGPRGNAPTAESPRRARRGASPVRSGPGRAPNTSAGFRCGHRNTP